MRGKWSILIVLCLVLTSCLDGVSNDKDSASSSKKVNVKDHKGGRVLLDAGSTSQYTGQAGRLMVVADNTVYTDEVKELIESFFAEPIRPYYPYTPHFEVYNRTMSEFKSLSTRLRNVIELIIDENVEKGNPTMHVFENYYAKTQLYTKLKAHDMQDLYKLILNEIDWLFETYERQEWRREYFRHRANKNTTTRERLHKKFGIDLVLPDKFSYESIDNNYAIIMFPDKSRQMDLKTTGIGSTSKVNFIQTGVMIWQYPFRDSSQLEEENLLRMRDTILKKYAKHEIKGVYMGTQYHPAAMPLFDKLRIGELEGYQSRGLFKFTGRMEPSGGRFWAYQFKHPTRNTIVALSGYIEAPPTISVKIDINKIKAVLYSVKPVD